MSDETPSDTQTQDEESHALSGLEHISRYLRGEEHDIAEESGDGIQNAENSNAKNSNKQEHEDGHGETSNQPRRGSFLSRAIKARPDLLQSDPQQQENLIRKEASSINRIPGLGPGFSYMESAAGLLSKNPNDRCPDLTREDTSIMRRGNHKKREQTSHPQANQSGRRTPERPERDNEAFTPTVRRRKSEYQEEQQRIARLSALRSQKQRSEEEVVVPESSAQGAQRGREASSLSSETSTNVNAADITRSRAGTTVEEKSSNATNNSPTRGPSTQWDFNEQRSSPNSNPRAVAVPRPLATPRQQHQRTFSSITRDSRSSEIMLPRWQPDAEVDECPICHKYFNFFSRKHHCRKCGRVVCNTCSPHRITIPYQYIVQPPVGFDDILPEHSRSRSRTISQNSVHDAEGGMKVRLCNPCVPDPNISPPAPILDRPLPPLPQSSNSSSQPPAMTTYPRERIRRSELCPVCGDRLPPSTTAIENHIDRCITRHLREVDFGTPISRERQTPGPPEHFPSSSSLPLSSNAILPSTRPRNISEATTLGNLGFTLTNSQEPDRNHLVNAATEAAPSRPFLSSRMICYAATQLDTVGEESECVICMEDFEEGVEMARLECLCKYHKKCIDGWFYKHPGRCPVHGQDNY